MSSSRTVVLLHSDRSLVVRGRWFGGLVLLSYAVLLNVSRESEGGAQGRLLPRDQLELHGDMETLQGRVIDPVAHLCQESERAADALPAQLLALLEDGTGLLYLLLAEAPGEDPRMLAADYFGRPVLLTGRLYQRGGLRGIVVTSIEPAETESLPSADVELED